MNLFLHYVEQGVTALIDLEPIVAIEFRDDGFRYGPSCGTKAVARQYDDTVRTVAEAAAVLAETNDGGTLTAGYPYDAAVIPSPVRSLGACPSARWPWTSAIPATRPCPAGSRGPSWTGCPWNTISLPPTTR